MQTMSKRQSGVRSAESGFKMVSIICPYHAAGVGCECVLRDREPSPMEAHCTLLDEQNTIVCPALG